MSYQVNFNVSLDCINKEELLLKMKENSNFVLVDTIGTYDGNKYKIKGARTIPYPEVVDRRKELESFDEVIIYCKHKECVASKKVAAGLQMQHFKNVKVYEGGIDEWTASELPLEDE